MELRERLYAYAGLNSLLAFRVINVGLFFNETLARNGK